MAGGGGARAPKIHQRRGVTIDDAVLAMLTRRRDDQEAYARQVGVELVADPFAHALEARDQDLARFLGAAVLGPVPQPEA
jgi:hypothetical protein